MIERHPRGRLGRREFFGFAWAVSLAGLAGQAAAALFRFLQPIVRPGAFGAEIDAGRLEEFAPGTVSYVLAARAYVVRLEDGGILALWSRCTHLGCTVPWREEQDQFNCPCHSSLFNRRGEVTGGPAPRPLDLFPVRIADGELYIDTGSPTVRARFDAGQVAHPEGAA